ncbi:MAG: hypothetical protein HZA61_15775 [Candidatus Eisenbacteria bacterium]|uniref:Uncharacterized protein n=1 Tax=Eiseniibacteriota bacterium TaxID=2212470 RepID=A0A933SJF1_UNCEI|nr:hypothetical protein [Candidatus Eisenbacteria bacterium]
MSARVCVASALTLLALAFSPPSAYAMGINLSWDDCGAYGAEVKTFACDRNAIPGTASLIGSFVPPAGSTAVTGEEAVLDVNDGGWRTIPDWWQFKYVGACRRTALTASADFTAYQNCADYWIGLAQGGVTAYITPYYGDAARARLLLIFATALANTGPLDEHLEYYAFRVTISGAKTVGTDACAGCSREMCIRFTSLKLTQPIGVGDYRIDNGEQRPWVLWQSKGVVVGCNAVIPTRNSTWGAIKSQYR